MKSRIIGRTISIVILGILIACLSYHNHNANGQLGRDGYLAKEAADFDKHYAKPDSIVIELIAGVCMSVSTLGGYELLAFGFSKIFKKVDDDEST